MGNKFNLVVALLLLSIQIASAQKARKLYPGFTAGWQYSEFQYRGREDFVSNNGAWRGALVLDYEITRRLSLHTQVGVQRINATTIFGESAHTLTYPELWVGFNEYLPVGGGALFLNVSLHTGYGFSSGGINVFANENYNRLRSGWGTLMGFVFRNGIYLNTGIQGAFTNYYDNGFGAKLFDFSAHAISIGYMGGAKERNRARRKY